MLGAGLDGIANNLETPAPTNADLYEMTAREKVEAGIDSLPASLHEALESLKTSAVMKKALGPHIFNKYVEGKEREWDAYRTAITDWEIKNYLCNF